MTVYVIAIALPLTACRRSSPPVEPEISGRVLYATNGCGACHGQEGKGDGPIAKTLTPPPRDFRDGASFKNERFRLAEYVLSLRAPPAQGADHGTPSKDP